MSSDNVEGAGGVRVSYTVKELLARIEASLAQIDLKLDLKADSRALEALAKRVDAQGDRITSVSRRVERFEERDEAAETRFSKREKVIGLILGVVAVLTPYILHTGGHW